MYFQVQLSGGRACSGLSQVQEKTTWLIYEGEAVV